jgi:hypothetical protein
MRTLVLLFSLLIFVSLAACGGRTVVESDLGVKSAPDWVNEGSQALNDRGGRLFQGVGQAPAMDDPSLQISAADNRARAEVARVLTTYVDLAASDFASAAASGGQTVSQQAISQQLRTASQMNLSGAKIIARWKEKKSGTIYSLAELDMNQVKQTLTMAKEMNDDVKRYMSDNAENLFDRFVQEKKQ